MGFFDWLGGLFGFTSEEPEPESVRRLDRDQRKTLDTLRRHAERHRSQRLSSIEAYQESLRTPTKTPPPPPVDPARRRAAFESGGALAVGGSAAVRDILETLGRDEGIESLRIVADQGVSRLVGRTAAGEDRPLGRVRYVVETPDGGSPASLGVSLDVEAGELGLTIRYPAMPVIPSSPSERRLGDLSYRIRSEAALRRQMKHGGTDPAPTGS